MPAATSKKTGQQTQQAKKNGVPSQDSHKSSHQQYELVNDQISSKTTSTQAQINAPKSEKQNVAPPVITSRRTKKQEQRKHKRIEDEANNGKTSGSNDENDQNEANLDLLLLEPEKTAKQHRQPTTEQMLIAKLIDEGSHRISDPQQRKKVKRVMEFTSKPEDIVHTALFDAEWDENRAIQLLVEGGDQLTDWAEAGKGGKKKKQPKTNQESTNDNMANLQNDPSFDDSNGNTKHKERSNAKPIRGIGLQRGGSRGTYKSVKDRTLENRPVTKVFNKEDNMIEEKDTSCSEELTGNSRYAEGIDRRAAPKRGAYRGRISRGNGDRYYRGGMGRQGTRVIEEGVNHEKSEHIQAYEVKQLKNTNKFESVTEKGKFSKEKRKPRVDAMSSIQPVEEIQSWDDIPAYCPQDDSNPCTEEPWEYLEYTESLAETKVFTNSSNKSVSQMSVEREEDGADKLNLSNEEKKSEIRSETKTKKSSHQNPDDLIPSITQHQQQKLPAAKEHQQQFTPMPNKLPIASMAVGAPISSFSSNQLDLSSLIEKPATHSPRDVEFNKRATENLRAAVGMSQSSGNQSYFAHSSDNNIRQYSSFNASDALNVELNITSDFNGNQTNKEIDHSKKQRMKRGQHQESGHYPGSQEQIFVGQNSATKSSEMTNESISRLSGQFQNMDLQLAGADSNRRGHEMLTANIRHTDGTNEPRTQLTNDKLTLVENLNSSYGTETNAANISEKDLSSSLNVSALQQTAYNYRNTQDSSLSRQSSKNLYDPYQERNVVGQGTENMDFKNVNHSSSSKNYSRGPRSSRVNDKKVQQGEYHTGHQNKQQRYGKKQGYGGGQFNQNQYGGNSVTNAGYSNASATKTLNGYANNTANRYLKEHTMKNIHNEQNELAHENSIQGNKETSNIDKDISSGINDSENITGNFQVNDVDNSYHPPRNGSNIHREKVSNLNQNDMNIINLPATMIQPGQQHPQFMAHNMPQFYGVPQHMNPSLYAGYGMEDMIMMQRQAPGGLHYIPSNGYYDPTRQQYIAAAGPLDPHNQSEEEEAQNGKSFTSEAATLTSNLIDSNTPNTTKPSLVTNDKLAFSTAAPIMSTSIDDVSSSVSNGSSENSANQENNLQQTGVGYQNNAYIAQQTIPHHPYYYYGQIPPSMHHAGYGAPTAVYPTHHASHHHVPVANQNHSMGNPTYHQKQHLYGTNYGHSEYQETISQIHPSKQGFNQQYGNGNGQIIGKASGSPQGNTNGGGWPVHQPWSSSTMQMTSNQW